MGDNQGDQEEEPHDMEPHDDGGHNRDRPPPSHGLTVSRGDRYCKVIAITAKPRGGNRDYRPKLPACVRIRHAMLRARSAAK